MKTAVVWSVALCLSGVLGAAALHKGTERTPARRTALTPVIDYSTFCEPNPVLGYRSWPKVNTKPQKILSWIAFSCIGPTKQQITEEAGNPHNDRYVTVYVNKLAAHAMLREKTPAFPAGAIIVKEKLRFANSKIPELLTVMRKRDPGYDPLRGDWEYLVLDGTGTQIQARGLLITCRNCHAKWRHDDYISREYLPATIESKLQ